MRDQPSEGIRFDLKKSADFHIA
jgi:hypothetical protein